MATDRLPSAPQLFWVGGYGPGMGGTASGIGLVRWDGRSLTFEGTAAVMTSPSFLAAHDGVLAVVDEERGRVHTFATDAGEGLAPIGVCAGLPTTGPNPCHVSVATIDGERMLLTSSYGDGSVDLFRCGADGGVRSQLATVPGPKEFAPGPRSEQDGPHAHSTLILDPRVPAPLTDGSRLVLSADLGTDTVHLHSLTAEGLAHRTSLATPNGTGPRDLLSLAGRVLLLGEFGGEVLELDINAADGTMAVVRSGDLAAEPAPGDQAAGLVAGPGGRFLYAGLRGSNRIAVMDAATLEPVAAVGCGGDWPRHLSVVGDGLFVANQRSGTVCAFTLDAVTGIPALTATSPVPTPTFLLPVP